MSVPDTPRAIDLALHGLNDVIAERLAQIEKHGHGLDADLDRPVDRLCDLVRWYATIVAERAARGEKQTLAGARRKAVQVAALGLAIVARIDGEIEQGGEA